MVRPVLLLSFLFSSLVLASPVEVLDDEIRERAANGLGRTRSDLEKRDGLKCGGHGEALLDNGLIKPIPKKGTCHFPNNGCVQYTCYTEDGIHSGVSVCGHGKSSAGCDAIFKDAQKISEKCTSSASILTFVNGQYSTSGYTVSIGNRAGGCHNPKYGGGKPT